MMANGKILYVDDEIINLKIFKVNFGNKVDILTAENGIEGLEQLEKNKDISVIITDMRMPKMDGIQFIEKAHTIFPDKKYYMLSSYEITDEIQSALNQKIIQKYLRKPFNYNEIISVITNN